MRAWFFQANPAHYDIDAALGTLDRIWWRVPQRASDIHVGDVAILWRSGKHAGIVGLGRISSDPQQHSIDEAEKPFVLDEREEGAADVTRVLIRVQHVSLIAKDQVRSVAELRQHQILVAPMGTVFPVSATQWSALGDLLPELPEPIERAGSALPPAFAWSQRAKGVLPMPGGYNGYLASLRKVCSLVADERPGPAELASRLESVLDVKPTAARLRESFLRKIGLVQLQAGTCSLGSWTEKWLESGDDRIVTALLHGRCQFIGELLDAARNPRSNDELLAVANDRYGMGWDTQTQVGIRRGWLQSAGMLTDLGDGTVRLSEMGSLFLAEITLHDVGSGPAVIKVVEAAPVVPAESRPSPDSPAVDRIIEAVSSSATDSSHPERFETATRNAFAFLGFQAEWLGGPGRTDVLLDAPLGAADAYRVVVDCKTSGSGSVSDQQVDWVTLSEHKEKHDAHHILLVAPNPTGSRMFARAQQYGVVVMSAGQLCGLCRQHARTPLGLDDYRSLFVTGGRLDTLALDEKAEEVHRLVVLAAAVWDAIRDRSATFGHMTARDLLLVLSENPVAEGTTADELQTLLETLASPLLNVLTGSNDGGYRVTTSAEVARRRIEIVARQLSMPEP
jgi:hypothetical protein